MSGDDAGVSPRLAPIPESEWCEDVIRVCGELPMDLNVYRTMAHHPALLRAWAPLRRQVVAETVLSRRQLEILTLRTARNSGAAYEWAHHVRRGRDAGLSDLEIAALVEKTPAVFVGLEQALVRAVDDLTTGFAVSARTWRDLDRHLDAAGVLQVLATVGFYVSLAYLIRSCEVQIEQSQRTM